EPCGECAGCRAAMNSREGPDYFEMDATQEKLRLVVDNALRRTSVAKSHSHPYIPRVFFIDEAHRAGPKTQETLLKDIEDHQEAIFILSTTQPDKLDPAIPSAARSTTSCRRPWNRPSPAWGWWSRRRTWRSSRACSS